MIHAIEMGWFVLSKYYGLSDATPAYAAAILLHPQKRACYIQKRWDKDLRQPAIDAVRSLWQSNYESLSEDNPMGLRTGYGLTNSRVCWCTAGHPGSGRKVFAPRGRAVDPGSGWPGLCTAGQSC